VAGHDVDDDRSVRAWLAEWGERVAGVDIEGARPLFDPDVVGFGTRAEVAVDLERLVADQWAHVWPSISGFAFDVDGARVLLAGDGRQAVIATTWTSVGPGGQRPGRATVVLRRPDRASPWRGIHTHFSLTPGPEQTVP
jgi:hypothetical protein